MRLSAEVQFMKLLRDCQRNPGSRVSFMRDAMNDPKLPPKTRRMIKTFMVLRVHDKEVWATTEEGKKYAFDPDSGKVTKGHIGIGNIKARSSGGEQTGKEAYRAKLRAEREEIHKKDDADQALFVYKSGFVDHDTAVEAMNNGTAAQLVDQYFDLMEYNGDPTPTKRARNPKDVDIAKEISLGKHRRDWDYARTDYISDWAHIPHGQAGEVLGQFRVWFGGSWTHANTDVLDDYIDRDGYYDGEIYRGMSFTEDQYQKFMQNMESGSRIGMNGHNSSWTTDREVAWGFSKGRERHVMLICKKNKTAAPVEHLSMIGESEVLAHSKTQWTVLRVNEGDSRTEIYLIEAEDRMSDDERNRRKAQPRDSVPDDKEVALEKRMNEQNEFLVVTPPPKGLFSKDSFTDDGGPGSGNWGHKGRPGQVGGSGKGGGAQYRGGRSDIAYVSSRQDWLNGLKGERQGEAQKFMKRMQEHYGSDKGKSVEQMIMEEPRTKYGGNSTRQQLLDFMAESRGWDKYASRLVDENLDENEKKLAETLGNKYGLAFVGGTALPDDKDTSAWDADDLRTWQDLKSKAMGGPTSGQEPPDELMYEAGLKERPKPKGPDYSFADQPRQTYNQKHLEDQLQLACGVAKPSGVNLNAAQGFGDLNQQFVDHIANDPLTKEIKDHGIRAIWGIRSLVEDANGTDKLEKMMNDRISSLSDDEKARLLECANEFLPYYKRRNYTDVDQLTLNDFSGIEQNMSYSRDTKAHREVIRDYLLLQEKLLTGAAPCSPEQHEINKAEAERKEQEKREAEKAEWKKTATPEWVESHYHPEKVAGMTRRSSGDMTFDEADGSAANPSFGLGQGLKRFRINCQTCVYAFEMRMRGYEVEAHGRNETQDIETRQTELAKDTTVGWIDPETGKAPELIRPQKRLANATRAKDWIESVVQPGQRYTFEFCYKDRGAHVISAGREANGDLFLYDPQSGKKRMGQEIVDYLGDGKNLSGTSGSKWPPALMRVDNLLPKQEYYDTVLKKSMFVQ